jgi:hypothetical protein
MVQLTRRQLLVSSLGCSLGLHPASLLFARQRPKPLAPPPRAKVKLEPIQRINTTIVIELLTAQGVGSNTREWSELFQELDVQLTIRKALEKEQPETSEKLLGTTLRDIHLLGRLERDGSITFSDRRYTVDDAVKIREWIGDMKLYGAQGTPKGQPLWGLSKAQFEPLFEACSPLIQKDLAGLTLDDALQAFTVRRQYPSRYSVAAAVQMKKVTAQTVQNQYQGLSEGAVLSALLNEFGLGFHPRRTPEGKLELGFVKLGERIETWPVGWPPSDDLVKLRPAFFQAREVELTDEPLLEVAQAISDLADLPLLINETGLKSAGIDVRTKKVSQKKGKIILSAALKHVCFVAKCKYEFRTDEAGKPLLWLTPDTPPKVDK